MHIRGKKDRRGERPKHKEKQKTTNDSHNLSFLRFFIFHSLPSIALGPSSCFPEDRQQQGPSRRVRMLQSKGSGDGGGCARGETKRAIID